MQLKRLTAMTIIVPFLVSLTGQSVYAFDIANSPEPYKQCVRAICGPDKGMLGTKELANRLPAPQDFEQIWLSTIQPTFTSFVRDQNEISQGLTQLQSSLSQMVPANLEKEDTAARLLKIRFLEEKFDVMKFMTEDGKQLDSQAFDRAVIGQTNAYKETVHSLLQSRLNAQEELMVLFSHIFRGSPKPSELIEMILTFRHPGLPLTKAMEIERQEIFPLIQEIKKIFGATAFKANDIERFLFNKKIENEKDREILLGALLFKHHFKTYIKSTFLKNLDQVQVNAEEMIETLQSWNYTYEDQEPFESFMRNCKKEMRDFAATRPTAEEVQRFNILKDKILQTAELVSEQMLQSKNISKQMTNTTLQLPRTWNEEKEQINLELNRAQLEIKQIKSQLGTHNFLEAIELLLDSRLSQGSAGFHEEICDKFSEVSLIDNASLELGSIQPSWMTVKMPKIGASILAHELGHVLSSRIKMNNLDIQNTIYAKARGCVTKRNPHHLEQNSRDQVYFPGDASQTEEDFADHFSARVLKEAGLLNTTKNMGCTLIAEKSEEALSWQTEPWAVHSPVFLRLLFLEVDLHGDAIPSSCVDSIREFEQNPRAMICE